LGPNEIDALLQMGAIYSNKRRVLEDRALEKGTYLRLHLQPKRFDLSGIDWKSLLIADTDDYVVVNKPYGVPVHASLDNVLENTLHQLRLATGYPLLVTQRLDIPVGGLLVFAKTSEFQKRFNQWLVDRKVKKTYVALSPTPPATGFHVHFMEPSEFTPKKIGLEERPGWQRCELTVERTQVHELGFESFIQLHTGRTHQIRSQLAALGAPIVGDKLYGSTQSYRPGRIALFSTRLEIPIWPKAIYELAPSW
jgi:23S rRNA pseudouridine1911/1915/1917 synthase